MPIALQIRMLGLNSANVPAVDRAVAADRGR
jgi:hypothetical protein